MGQDLPRLTRLSFADLPGWPVDDHLAAFRAFLLSAAHVAAGPARERPLGPDAEQFARVAERARLLPNDAGRSEARRFFEESFEPFVVGTEGEAFFTGYYEPEVRGSRIRTAGFETPLYRRPGDLVEIDAASRPSGMDGAIEWARQTAGGIEPFADRAAIEAGALHGQDLELVFLANPIDAFFIHIQGSARIRLVDGGTMRVTFAGKSGHAYTPIGRVLRERGALESPVTMDSIRAWLAANPAERQAVMNENRSFIFFREAPVDDELLGPVAAAGVPLVAGRSLAVDRKLHAFHMPVFIETTLASGAPFRRLLIAQDTGSAIVGPARGDIFFGSGDAAGRLAGAMQSGGRFVLLRPRL